MLGGLHCTQAAGVGAWKGGGLGNNMVYGLAVICPEYESQLHERVKVSSCG